MDRVNIKICTSISNDVNKINENKTNNKSIKS